MPHIPKDTHPVSKRPILPDPTNKTHKDRTTIYQKGKKKIYSFAAFSCFFLPAFFGTRANQ